MVLQLPDLSPLVCLKKLDLSINQLRSMATLSTLQASKLKEVYITSNKVSTIEVWLFVVKSLLAKHCSQMQAKSYLSAWTSLHMRQLSRMSSAHNRWLMSTGTMEPEIALLTQGLGKMSQLELLELGDNRISQIDSLDKLQSLRELWLGRNRIASISGLSRYTYVVICIHSFGKMASLELVVADNCR